MYTVGTSASEKMHPSLPKQRLQSAADIIASVIPAVFRSMAFIISSSNYIQAVYTERILTICENHAIQQIQIQNDLEKYIQTRGTSIASDVSSIERSYISIEDVASSAQEYCNESILLIPVGQSGTEAISLPLSCKDENSTVAGQCIGYMAIGQSGSGKSSFFHSIVLNGSLKYSPADLQFWLLDFKYGGASSKYRQSEIPHIRIIAENNKIDDAFCFPKLI